jgi:transposase
MLHHGIDLHKHSLVIDSVDEDGTLVGSKRLRTRRADILRYFQSLDGPHQAVVETTTGWYWLADLFHQHAIDLKLAHALRLTAISAAKVKTDAIDASTLAHLLRAGLIPEAHMLDPELRPYRDLLRLRQRLVYKRSASRCAIESLLEKYNQPSPDQLPPLPAMEASMHTEQIELLVGQVKEIERTLNDVLLPLQPVQRLLYIPGFGTMVAFTVFLETGDPTRFASERHYTSYCRLVPGAKNSGGKTKSRPSKQGNRYLKNAFINAAVRAVQYEPVVKVWYNKKCRKKAKPLAQTLVAKELARIAFRVLHDDTDYNGTFKGVPITKPKAPRWPRRASPSM